MTNPTTTTTTPPVAVCALCGQIGHLPTGCEHATGGSATLVQRAIEKYAVELGEEYGVQVKLARAIGVAKESLTRVKSGGSQFSPEKRKIIVEYLRTGKLPATPPERRRGGREPEPISPTDKPMGPRQVHTTPVDRLALIRLGKVHPHGMMGVLAEALAAWVEKYPSPPSARPRILGTVRVNTLVPPRELAAFDAAVGGPAERPRWMPQAIGEWVAQDAFASTIGEIPDDIEAAIDEASAAARPVRKYGGERPNDGPLRSLALCKALASKKIDITPQALVDGLGISRNSANQLLQALLLTEHLERVGHGKYVLATPQPETPPRRLPKLTRFVREQRAAARAAK